MGGIRAGCRRLQLGNFISTHSKFVCICVLKVGLYSVLMLGFLFISSQGSELVTLIRYQVKIKPYGLQDFCLVVQQIFLSAQWSLFGATGPRLQAGSCDMVSHFSSQPSSPQTLSTPEAGACFCIPHLLEVGGLQPISPSCGVPVRLHYCFSQHWELYTLCPPLF